MLADDHFRTASQRLENGFVGPPPKHHLRLAAVSSSAAPGARAVFLCPAVVRYLPDRLLSRFHACMKIIEHPASFADCYGLRYEWLLEGIGTEGRETPTT